MRRGAPQCTCPVSLPEETMEDMCYYSLDNFCSVTYIKYFYFWAVPWTGTYYVCDTLCKSSTGRLVNFFQKSIRFTCFLFSYLSIFCFVYFSLNCKKPQSCSFFYLGSCGYWAWNVANTCSTWLATMANRTETLPRSLHEWSWHAFMTLTGDHYTELCTAAHLTCLDIHLLSPEAEGCLGISRYSSFSFMSLHIDESTFVHTWIFNTNWYERGPLGQQ
jgi:hypothetical protein